MKKLLGVILASIVLGFAGSANAEISKADLNKQVDQTNFLLDNDCSATLVDKDHGYLLTANHCIADQYEEIEREEVQKDGTFKKVKRRIAKPGTVSQISFVGANEVSRISYVYKVKAHDVSRDLGLVQVVSVLPNTQAASIACKEPQRLDDVYAVGNPYVVLYANVTKGIITSIARSYRTLGINGDNGEGSEENGDSGFIQHSASIWGGNSGGALLNENGELIGVNVRGGSPTMSFAVPLADVRQFLTDSGVAFTPCAGGDAGAQ